MSLLTLYVDVGVPSTLSILVTLSLIVKPNTPPLREILLFCSGGWDLLILGVRDIENFTSSSMTSTVSFSAPFVTVTDLSALSTIL